jgi:F0F1-type ATP synthase assembly protein I
VSAIDLPRARRLAFGVVASQAAVSVVAALCAFALGGRRAAVSALAGGGIATVGSLAMA